MKFKCVLTCVSFLFLGCASVDDVTMQNEALALKSGDLGLLEKTYRTVSREDLGGMSVRFDNVATSLANAYMKSGDIDNAMMVLSTINRESLQKEVLVAKAFLARGDIASMSFHLKSLTCDDMGDLCADLFRMKMLCAVKEKKLDDAMKYSHKQRLYGGLTPVARNDLAAIYMLLGEYKKAEPILLSILQQEPGNEIAKKNLMVVHNMEKEK